MEFTGKHKQKLNCVKEIKCLSVLSLSFAIIFFMCILILSESLSGIVGIILLTLPLLFSAALFNFYIFMFEKSADNGFYLLIIFVILTFLNPVNLLAIFGFINESNKKTFYLIPIISNLAIPVYISLCAVGNVFFLLIIGFIVFISSMLLFVLKNEIITKITIPIKIIEGNQTEELAILKNKFELGIITEEEYTKKRAEIIDKL